MIQAVKFTGTIQKPDLCQSPCLWDAPGNPTRGHLRRWIYLKLKWGLLAMTSVLKWSVEEQKSSMSAFTE